MINTPTKGFIIKYVFTNRKGGISTSCQANVEIEKNFPSVSSL